MDQGRDGSVAIGAEKESGGGVDSACAPTTPLAACPRPQTAKAPPPPI